MTAEPDGVITFNEAGWVGPTGDIGLSVLLVREELVMEHCSPWTIKFKGAACISCGGASPRAVP